MNGLVSDSAIPHHELEVDDEIESIGMPTIEDSESEDENSSNPRRGHVRRQVETIEAPVLDKDDVLHQDDVIEKDLRDPFCPSPTPPTADHEIGAVGFEPKRPHGGPPAWKIGNRRFRLVRGITVDAGVANNVMPRRLVKDKMNKGKIRTPEASRAGVHYVAANNGRIQNEGEVDLQFNTSSGDTKSMCFQVAEVNKALAAVSALVDINHRVVLDKDMKTGADISFIIDKKTGISTRMRRERNVWVIDA